MRRKEPFSNEKKKDDEDNPFTKPTVKQKREDAASFRSYLKTFHRNWSGRLSSDVGFLGRKKIHMRFLRQGKRVTATLLFFLYLVLGVVAVPNPMALLFFFTSFLLLDYLWKSRRVEWKKEET